MYKWKDDMKNPGYEPEQLCAQGLINVDHTISGQGTTISTLDHSTTIPSLTLIFNGEWIYSTLTSIWSHPPGAQLVCIVSPGLML